MFAATTSPWYLPTWVSNRTPVTSPTAQRFSPNRRWASTARPPGPAGPPTGGHQQSVTTQFPAVVQGERDIAVHTARADGADTERKFDPVTPEHLPERLTQ